MDIETEGPWITLQVAELVVSTTFEDLPSDVVHACEDVLLDAVSNMLAGSREPMAGTMRAALTEIYGLDDAGATVVGHSERLPILAAVFANSVFCHCMDYEMMWYPLTHPTSPTVPALLALTEKRLITGRELIVAIALAFEIQGRLRKATVDGGLPHLYGMHPPGVVGAVGAAVGSAKLLGLNAHQTAMSMSMACSRASGLMVNTGTMTKATHSGNAARMGLESAFLVRAGCTASKRGLEGHFGLNETLYEGKMALQQMVQEFGQPYRMVDPGLAVKRFPTQYPTHWSIEAAIDIHRRYSLEPDEITTVEIEVGANNESAARVWPETGLEGKFCLAYGVAAALLDEKVVIPTFRDERLHRTDMEDIKGKIVVHLNPEIDAMNFALARSTVRVTTKSRGVLASTVTRPLGIWDNPLTREQREDKFHDCATHAGLKPDQQASLLGQLRQLVDSEDVSTLVRSLAIPETEFKGVVHELAD